MSFKYSFLGKRRSGTKRSGRLLILLGVVAAVGDGLIGLLVGQRGDAGCHVGGRAVVVAVVRARSEVRILLANLVQSGIECVVM